MADEWGHVAVGDNLPDGRVDQVREKGDAVLRKFLNNLHDTGGELQDRNLGAPLHLRDRARRSRSLKSRRPSSLMNRFTEPP